VKASIPLFIASIGVFAFAAIAPQTHPHRDVNFDRDVMPILSQHCFKCHGPDAAKAAGLRLDQFESATKAQGDQTAITPGLPEKSYLIQRVTAKEMPPPDSGVKPLTDSQIETLKEWIKQGAHYEKHWSYIPPVMPKLPSVSDPKWCKNLVDRFVLAKLDQAHLKPEPEADKDTLALRAAQTLTGLPPSQKELDAFRNDNKPGAYERYVDRLLAKPAYGEHEARYWLDAVRYGDTHGLQLDNERGIYPYRDWVVRAYNQDLPFTKFVEWQLAGDLLPNPTTEQLIATGYVRMNLTSAEGGAIEEEFLARNTFDRVDTTTTVFLGLTVQCAKCHDHKYDPIKQRDYYGLYAFFDSTKDAPLDGNISLPPPVIRAATPEQDAQLAAMTNALDKARNAIDPNGAAIYFDKTRAPVPATRDWQISPIYTSKTFDEEYDKPEPPEPDQTGTVPWKPFKFEVGKDYQGIIGKDQSSVYIKGTVSLPAARTMAFGVASDDAVKVWLNGKLIHAHKINRGVVDGVDPVTGDFRAGDNELIVKVVNGAGPDGVSVRLYSAADKRISDAVAAYRKAPTNQEAHKGLASAYLELGPNTPAAIAYRKGLEARSDFEASIPMTLIAQEMAAPRPTFILKRGLYDQKGERVTRHIPAALGDLPVNAPANRLGFAQWLISPKNPLLARVFVNRVWQQHFGVGIVKTAEDFGSQGEWPLDQPLLDYLAVSFEQNDWSVKKLNRLIVTSAAFRQASKITTAKLSRDPENRLMSRGPRFRLDAEVIRDKALWSGGLLLEQLGGHGFKPYQPTGIWEATSDPASSTHFYVRDKGNSIYRRSMYLFWKRTAPPPSMLTFDAPLRDTCIVRRSTTNTPLQALAIENEPAFLEASRTMAQRLLSVKVDDHKRMRLAFDLTLCRSPRPAEIAVLKRALDLYRRRYNANVEAARNLLKVGDSPQAKGIPAPEQAAWMLISSTLMNTDEFLTLH
jgi:hypothetical protein